MSPKPPRAAVWLVELFAPIESADGVLGDLEEEFAARLTLVSNLPIYDYDTSVWSWRAATLVRFVVMPVLGWSIAASARGREGGSARVAA